MTTQYWCSACGATLPPHLTAREQHRLACGTCGQRLRDHNEQSGHAFVRTFAPDPAPLDVERLAEALQRVIDNGDALALFREDAAAITAEYTREDKPPPPSEPTLDVERLDIRWLLDNSAPMHYVGCGIGPCVCGVEAKYDAIIDRQAAREYAALEEPTP